MDGLDRPRQNVCSVAKREQLARGVPSAPRHLSQDARFGSRDQLMQRCPPAPSPGKSANQNAECNPPHPLRNPPDAPRNEQPHRPGNVVDSRPPESISIP
ncbi:Hypothetical protein NTJ_00856 [Nesidiocoris tenuis]|uniref:Uncharacterized protein n=1 Tax=Nesidiocoris tenuis TaxID=355587 RepID=A0ABN7AB31_9HEMI|nr:Hypothetical protein NTJ_00856 [Nesidiocoris tenuis]